MFQFETLQGAVFSPCRVFRYQLWRSFTHKPCRKPLVVIGLNPSTATETINDPTIRRCIGFAQSFGHDGLVMYNIFAIRMTDSSRLKHIDQIIGPDNDIYLQQLRKCKQPILAAWGVHGVLKEREADVRKMLNGKLKCLGITQNGHPRHPLYLPKTATMRSFDCEAQSE